ncbi:hypothetical protein quinque_008613 [Culex quinquefasciatus]
MCRYANITVELRTWSQPTRVNLTMKTYQGPLELCGCISSSRYAFVHCPDLAITLLKNDIASTLHYLLTGPAGPVKTDVELVPRSPSELFEITCLIGD